LTHALQPLAHAIRFLAIDAIVRAQEGHQGVPLGMAEIATALYTRHFKHNPTEPQWWDRDRVVLSNGHGSMLLYALLYLSGYERISLDQIKSFRVLGSHCAGHPEFDPAAGIEVTTGPLGQGIANALGMAVAEAFLNARFGDGLINHRTYAFVGDGCLQEGIGQEAIALAGHLRLGKLTFLWDDNLITDDGSTALSISEDVAQRFRVAGWFVQEIDGHDIEAVSAALDAAHADPRPSLLACRTVIARGIARLQGQRGGHSARLFDADAKAAREILAWPHAPFEMPAPVLKAWRDAGCRSNAEHAAWQARLAALPAVQRAEFERVMRGELPAGCLDVLRAHATGANETARASAATEAATATATAVAQATAVQTPAKGGINLSSDIHDALTDLLPERMVLCADLEAPTAHKRRLKSFTADDRSGAYVHCGVREHVMAAMANGMAAHGGVRPAAVTYLAFADYERPAMRMAALMGLPVTFVFSHDSIGIGTNGPTHQPVEVLASLRSMPNMLTMRPADATEAAECWAIALEHRSGPVSLVFARQALPRVRSLAAVSNAGGAVRAEQGVRVEQGVQGEQGEQGGDNLSRQGAYVLAEAQGSARRVTLLATGSEVAIAVRARLALQALAIPTAVVSMPCWELFEAQPAAYRSAVLGPGTVRVGIEAALRFGWDRYLGEHGRFVGMRGFGASGPAEALYRHFGITEEAVVNAALAALETLQEKQDA
jgi:transketolase